MAFPPHNYGFPAYAGVQSHPQIVFNPLINQRFAPGQPASQPKTEATTVFVGNITEKCPDDFVQKVLKECGKVTNWKRIQGTNGKLQGFGFCTFEAPEGTLRALRILNEFQIGEKKLLVKAEEKVRLELRTHALAIRKRMGKPDLQLKDNELPADDEDLKKDEEVRLKVLNWIETDHPDLLVIAEDGELSDKDGKKKKKDGDRRRRSLSRERKSRRSRSADSPRRKRRRHSSSSSGSRSSRSSSSGSDSRSRSRSPKSNRGRRRSGSRTSEDSDDAREKREVKKQLKKKSAEYKSRLNRWESRERMRAKLYQKTEKKEKEKKKFQIKEARRLKTFLEDYDDEKDDQKYFKSSTLFHRNREYEKEREADEKDRIQEQQEIEDIKRQILEENKEKEVEAVEEEARKRHKEKEDAAMKRIRADSGSPNPHQQLGEMNGQPADDSSSSSSSEDEEDDKAGIVTNGNSESYAPSEVMMSETSTPVTTDKKWQSVQVVVSNRRQMSASNSPALVPAPPAPPVTVVPIQPNIAQRLNGVFGVDDDEEIVTQKKKLTKIEISKEERSAMMNSDEKKQLNKEVIKQIPMNKQELFAKKIEWDQLNATVMEKRVRPWITKKIAEFLGEEERSLVDFVCEKINKQTPPETILNDVAMIIDEDAEMFVIKLWRLLIYEGMMRKLGFA